MMYKYPVIDPVAIAIGPLQIHWYGLTYLVGLSLAWWLLRSHAKNDPYWSSERISDLVFYAAVGIVIGGRVGYMLFYGWDQLVDQPLNLFKVWQGGMSFHGGMLGVVLAMLYFAHRQQTRFFLVMDYIAPAVPLGLGMGRLGNFINAELPGRVSEVPWALVYPAETFARHPSSLYQMVLEGPVLFLILSFFGTKQRPMMAVSGMFLLSYGTLRCISEFFREPDAHLQFIALGWVTMGQVLSLPMIVLGLVLLVFAGRSARGETAPG